MLSPTSFAPSALQAVAAQIGRHASVQMREASRSGSRVELAETFDVFELALPLSGPTDARLRSQVTSHGQWHHQIRHGVHAREFALSDSVAHDPGVRLLRVSFVSPIAQNIDAAIVWMDQHHSRIADGQVHLLFVPALLAHAFWIETEAQDFLVMADYPAALTQLSSARFYEANEFLQVLFKLPAGHGLSAPPTAAGGV